MLYKHRYLTKKLREHGRTALAQILSIRTEGRVRISRGFWSDDDDQRPTRWSLCRLKLRVMPRGEAPFEVTVRTRLRGFKTKGDTVHVLYDPDDHDKVVVDQGARQKVDSATLNMAGGDPELAALLELDQAQGRAVSAPAPAPAPAPASQARLDQLQQLADLHDRGVLSDGEFAVEKAKILNEP